MRRVVAWVALIAVGAIGLAAGVFTGSGAASPKAAKAAEATTKVTVAASEFKFKLSKTKVPVGTVIFTVVNKGKISHDFKIAGKKTKSLLPGQKATLKISTIHVAHRTQGFRNSSTSSPPARNGTVSTAPNAQ